MIEFLQNLPGWVIIVGCAVMFLLGIGLMLLGLDDDCYDLKD